jgi:hypothetical protein
MFRLESGDASIEVDEHGVDIFSSEAGAAMAAVATAGCERTLREKQTSTWAAWGVARAQVMWVNSCHVSSVTTRQQHHLPRSETVQHQLQQSTFIRYASLLCCVLMLMSLVTTVKI